jgi:hypothetical protein
MLDKCEEVYQKIQRLAPGDAESRENLHIVKGGGSGDQALQYFRAGEQVVAALLLGHYIENRLKALTTALTGRVFTVLSEGLREMEQSRRISRFRAGLFNDLMFLRNKAVHKPTTITEEDFKALEKKMALLEKTAS